MDHTVFVPLVGRPVWMFLLGESSPKGRVSSTGVRGEPYIFSFFLLLTGQKPFCNLSSR